MKAGRLYGISAVILTVILGILTNGCGLIDSSNGSGTPAPSDSAAIVMSINTVDSAQIMFASFVSQTDSAAARTQLVEWLKARDDVVDAGISPDGYTIWLENIGGISSAILTYKKRPQSFGPTKSFRIERNRDSLGIPDSIWDIINDPQYEITGVGMNAILLSPFNFEFGTTDEIPLLMNYYTDPITKQPISAIMYKDTQVTPDVLKAALFNPALPANHIIMNTHGGITRVNGKNVGLILTGIEANDILTLIPHKHDLKEKRLVISGENGNEWLGFTPEFVRYYSGKPPSGSEHFLVRYVHINACHSFDSTMVNAFLDNGALCYSGFTHLVSCAFGKDVAEQYYTSLSGHETIQEAFDQVTPKLDPYDTSGQCEFKVKGKTNPQRFFYRTFMTFGGTSMSSHTCQWLPVFTGGTGDSTWFETSIFLNSDTSLAGRLLVGFTSPAAGTYSAVEYKNIIRFEEQASGRTWIADAAEYSVHGKCSGTIEIKKFEDKNGGTVEGSFSGVLTSPHLTLPNEWNTQSISGTFVLIRSNS